MKGIKISCILLFAMALFAGCSDDDSLKTGVSTQGLPASINLELDVPASQKVTVSRGLSDIESEVKELILVMFENNSNRKEIIDLTDKLTSASSTVSTGQRTYKVSEDIKTLSGSYRVYAIANYTSAFCGLTASSLEGMSESELKSTLTKAQEVIGITDADRYPMSSYTSEVNIYPSDSSEGKNGNKLSLSLKRLTSHIEFVFKNGSNSTTSDVNFVPKSYRVFYLPKTANLFSNDGSNIVEKGEYFHYTTPVDVSTHSFDFFMLENVRPAGTNITGYHQRDEWDTSKGIDPKTFTNAPENATYVVVSGNYEDSKYHGEVSYTIHLGDFSNKSSYDNFTVNRNEHHTYTITVNGVNSIIAEVDVEKPENSQPGAEGNLVYKSNSFVLDSHYETVMIQFSKADIDKFANGEVQIYSPGTNWTIVKKQISTLTDDDDYKWIQFQKPTSTTAFPIYAGREGGVKSGALKSGLVYLKDFAANPTTYCLQSGDTYYTTAFVDEYVYENLAIDQYVNTNNRMMIINLDDASKSSDAQSSLVKQYSVEITQRSIKTTYTLPTSSNIFGIETWNETGDVSAFTRGSSTLSATDGYANTKTLMSVSSGSNWSTSYPNKWVSNDRYYQNAGYLTKITDNLKSSHTWTLSADNAMKACLTRNRDFNGNGAIDASELEWYLPAIQQYVTIWLGQDRLMEDTRLFDESLFNDDTFLNNTDTGYSKLFTSSDDSNLVYWPDQGASISPRGHLGESWLSNTHGIRCCRNLNSSNNVSTAASLPYAVDTDKRIITVGNVQNVRTTKFTGFYGFHTERDEENLLPQAFEVYKSSISITPSDANVLNVCSKGSQVGENLETLVKAAMENANISLGEGWRIPNQRELLLAYQCGLLTSYSNYEVSSTWYTAYNANPTKKYPFGREQSGSNFIFNVLGGDRTLNTVSVWLVRDAEPASVVYDSSYSNSGTAFGLK